MIYPIELETLISYFKKLPGIGEKTAERLALSIFDFSLDDVKEFSNSLINTKNNLHPCQVCGNLTSEDKCNICLDNNRDSEIICVIEDLKSLYAFEKVGNFKGTYHILNGLINPMNNVGVNDIQLDSLVKRVKTLKNPELILALRSSIEAETTILYIKKIFEKENVVISRLSYGIPMGADIDYLDIITLDKALEDRKKISE